jgi:hypothetical protein
MNCGAAMRALPMWMPKRKSPGHAEAFPTLRGSPVFVRAKSHLLPKWFNVAGPGQQNGTKVKSTWVALNAHAGVQNMLVMGFPPHHWFPPNGTRSPGVPPVRRGFSYETGVRTMPSSRCKKCDQPLVEIDHWGERLTGSGARLRQEQRSANSGLAWLGLILLKRLFKKRLVKKRV